MQLPENRLLHFGLLQREKNKQGSTAEFINSDVILFEEPHMADISF